MIDTPKVRELAAAMAAADEFGPLHIVLGDDNLDESHILWCRDKWPNEGGPAYADWTPEDRHACELMLAATEEERESAAGLNNGCWGVVPPSQERAE